MSAKNKADKSMAMQMVAVGNSGCYPALNPEPANLITGSAITKLFKADGLSKNDRPVQMARAIQKLFPDLIRNYKSEKNNPHNFYRYRTKDGLISQMDFEATTEDGDESSAEKAPIKGVLMKARVSPVSFKGGKNALSCEYKILPEEFGEYEFLMLLAKIFSKHLRIDEKLFSQIVSLSRKVYMDNCQLNMRMDLYKKCFQIENWLPFTLNGLGDFEGAYLSLNIFRPTAEKMDRAEILFQKFWRCLDVYGSKIKWACKKIKSANTLLSVLDNIDELYHDQLNILVEKIYQDADSEISEIRKNLPEEIFEIPVLASGK